jgi:hypothetical protein
LVQVVQALLALVLVPMEVTRYFLLSPQQVAVVVLEVVLLQAELVVLVVVVLEVVFLEILLHTQLLVRKLLVQYKVLMVGEALTQVEVEVVLEQLV